MRAPQYLTWDKVRSGWVFQQRIPVFARAAFGGKTTIRKRLAETDIAPAAETARRLADNYNTIFAKYKPKNTNCSRRAISTETVTFQVDDEIFRRFVATWKAEQYTRFVQRYHDLRNATEIEWDAWEQAITEDLAIANKLLRRHDAGEFLTTKQRIETQLNITLTVPSEIEGELVRRYNSSRAAYFRECLDVLHNIQDIDTLHTNNADLLPLIELWGHSATELALAWKQRVEATNSRVRLKTFHKYTSISRDFSIVMGRRPVEAVTSTDLCRLTSSWILRGNQPTTILDKLRILRSLLTPYIPDITLDACFKMVRTNVQEPRTVRRAFFETELETVSHAILRNTKVRHEDKMLWILLVLTGARIEEVYQLRANDILQDAHGWTIRIADHRQTGCGDSTLKNACSARHLPLKKGMHPEFDAWLHDKVSTGERLFPDGSENVYGNRSQAASKRLNRIIRSLFPSDKRLVLHSTRSTANAMMVDAEVDRRMRHRVLGHTLKSSHDKNYETDPSLDGPKLLVGMDAIARGVARALNDGSPVDLLHTSSISHKYNWTQTDLSSSIFNMR